MPGERKRMAVVGQGIMGLSSAWRLLEAGHAVDLYSRDDFNASTSMAAGAYWWPHRSYPAERIGPWARQSYLAYKQWSADPASGVFFENHFRFCVDPDDSIYARHLLEDWVEIDGARHGVPCREAYRLRVPVIDVPIFMPYLRGLLENAGAVFHRREIESPRELFPEHEVVVNCTGVGAGLFAEDKEVFPIRGQVVRVAKPPGLEASTRVYRKDGPLTLVLPRREDVILGGTTGEGDWDLRPRECETRQILASCAEVVPEVAQGAVLGVAVGLRPGRREVRLDVEWLAPGEPVVHNYGHGGAGYTVAWGCADEVKRLTRDCLSVKVCQ